MWWHTRSENRFRLSAKRTSPFKSAGGRRQFSRLLAAEVCASAVVMLDIQCSEVVWRVLVTHSIRQFPLPFPSRASSWAIMFQLESASCKLCVILVLILKFRENPVRKLWSLNIHTSRHNTTFDCEHTERHTHSWSYRYSNPQSERLIFPSIRKFSWKQVHV